MHLRKDVLIRMSISNKNRFLNVIKTHSFLVKMLIMMCDQIGEPEKTTILDQFCSEEE